ncbi:hypothetical protein TNIN_27061 [Trichonephila inaurata madagascariensis]|uniref:Uncharacterized protein n=1 Tax=Trichonephila inaurata madagascariensis TaxID=2747483 RepID=A0A8X7C4C7_9ARAC|nr:hypothetical protein TNIN_27061 [Trichonephila inaurata madagascariensis]
MAMIKDNPRDVDYTHATLPNSGTPTPGKDSGPPSVLVEATKADIRPCLEDEDDPTYVEMLGQRTYYEISWTKR